MLDECQKKMVTASLNALYATTCGIDPGLPLYGVVIPIVPFATRRQIVLLCTCMKTLHCGLLLVISIISLFQLVLLSFFPPVVLWCYNGKWFSCVLV
jgi:hypothetical protein